MNNRNKLIKSPTATPNLDIITLWAFAHLDKICAGDIETMKSVLATRPELSSTPLSTFAQFLDHRSIEKVRSLVRQIDSLLLTNSRSSLISNAVSIMTPRCSQDFKEGEILGSGGFGIVVKAVHKIDGRSYAIKKIPIKHDENTPKLLSKCNKLVSEAKILSSLNSDFVVRYHNSFLDPPNLIEILAGDVWKRSISSGDEIKLIQASIPPSPSIDSELTSLTSSEFSEDFSEDFDIVDITNVAGYLCLQMELMNSNLRDVLDSRNDFLSREEIVNLIRQIAQGLSDIHQNDIIHRDIKPANIFLSSHELIECSVKIGDFGLSRDTIKIGAKTINYQVDCICDDMTSCVGTAMYAAPEQLESGTYDQSADIYSLGVVLVELLSWPTTQSQAYLNRTKIEKGAFSHPYTDLLALATEMLSPKPEIRPKAQEIISRLSDQIKDEMTSWYEAELQRLRLIISEAQI